ncbi:MAG TPA: helix-turn-helix transcriptional regulator, partial [Pyrinomonadaceae bacterium]
EALKAKRLAAKLSQQSFAKSMKSSQSRIAKAEANDPSVSLDLLVRSLIALGASIAELGKILEIKQASADFDSVAANQSSSETVSQTTKRKQTKQPTKRATTKRARKGVLRAKKGTAKAA